MHRLWNFRVVELNIVNELMLGVSCPLCVAWQLIPCRSFGRISRTMPVRRESTLILVALPDWVPYVAAVVAIVAIIYAISAWFDRKRTEALTALSLEMGFFFVGKEWKDVPQPPQLETALFNRGHSKTFRNIMSGSVAGLRAYLFDYKYTVGGGRSSRTFSQTVAAYCKSGVQLPPFSLQPQGMMHKLWDAVVHKDITFESNPSFAQRYILRSEEVERARTVFTPTLLVFLEALDPQKKWQIEGVGDTLLVYRGGKKAKPAAFKTFLEETSALASQFLSLGNCR
jgi:hypothetical protein